MSQFPPGIIFVNSDIPQPDGYVDGYINDLTIGTLTTQLFIDNILTFPHEAHIAGKWFLQREEVEGNRKRKQNLKT